MHFKIASPRRIHRGLAALFASVSVALGLAACDEEIHAADYDQRCQVASDCITVPEGQPACCGFNQCSDNAAISKSEFQQYLSDYKDAASASCSGTYECPDIQPGACPPAPAACVSGICQLAKAKPALGK